MRKLIVIEEDAFVNIFLDSGVFDRLDGPDTYYVSGPIKRIEDVRGRANYVGPVTQPDERRAPYHLLRKVILTSHRFRSRGQRKRLAKMPFRYRLRFKFWALPGVRQLLIRRTLRRLGLHPELHPIMEELRPDIVILPTGGVDTLTYDAARSAKALGIPSLSIIYGWDNLSLKGVFPSESDYYAVPGEQSREIAQRIHGIPPERVFPIGQPYIDEYFHRVPGEQESPYPFRYALFAGGSLKWDERRALERLDREIEERQLDIKIIYRPHPNRAPRDVPDYVDESKFRHVMIDPSMRERYLWTVREGMDRSQELPLVQVHQYPDLLEHAEFVVSSITTMMLEAAAFERQVVVIGYDDGIHPETAEWLWDWEFLQGLEDIEGFAICRSEDDLARGFVAMATGVQRAERSVRDQIRYMIYGDERRYAERLAELVEDLA